MDTSRHTGKVVIVTGAASGIGRASAIRFAAEGGSVFAFDVNEAGLNETRDVIVASGGKCEVICGDVTIQADVERLVAHVGSRIDVLANIAGIMDNFRPLGELDDATWDRVLDVNLTGVMRLSRAALPVMIAQGGGAIVTVASKASLGAGASGIAYTSSKHAVIGLVKSTAYFYGTQGIRSNAVLPGPVETNIFTTSAPHSEWAMQRAQLSMATLTKSADPDQIATVISWLACDEASNVNGAVVSSDGGWATA
jgi:NAD(P)-dependent dehydrogenase (short-subunit alcohol dehydrogenase family)